MVAFAIVLRSLVEVVFQRFQRRDDLVGVDAAGILDGSQHGAGAAIAERAIVSRQLAVIHLAEGAVERLGRGEFVLKPPVERTSADHTLECLRPGRNPTRMREQRRDDLGGLLDTEIGRLFQRDLLITPEIADAQDVGLQRLNARQQGREVAGAERVPEITEIFNAEGLADLEETADHFIPVGIVRGQERDLLAEFREGVTAHGARGDVWIERFMEGEPAEIRRLVDGIGLADRIEDDAAFLGDVVDRELNRGGKTADDEVHLLLLDQFQGPCRRLAGIELVVTHQQFRLAPVKAAGIVELGDGKLRRAHLVLRLGAIGPGQRNRKADLDIGFLGLQQVDAKRRGGKGCPRAHRRQQTAAGNRSGFGDAFRHVVLPVIAIFGFACAVLG